MTGLNIAMIQRALGEAACYFEALDKTTARLGLSGKTPSLSPLTVLVRDALGAAESMAQVGGGASVHGGAEQSGHRTGMRRCEACRGPGPCMYAQTGRNAQRYVCRACHPEPDDQFFVRPPDKVDIEPEGEERSLQEDLRRAADTILKATEPDLANWIRLTLPADPDKACASVENFATILGREPAEITESYALWRGVTGALAEMDAYNRGPVPTLPGGATPGPVSFHEPGKPRAAHLGGFHEIPLPKPVRITRPGLYCVVFTEAPEGMRAHIDGPLPEPEPPQSERFPALCPVELRHNRTGNVVGTCAEPLTESEDGSTASCRRGHVITSEQGEQASADAGRWLPEYVAWRARSRDDLAPVDAYYAGWRESRAAAESPACDVCGGTSAISMVVCDNCGIKEAFQSPAQQSGQGTAMVGAGGSEAAAGWKPLVHLTTWGGKPLCGSMEPSPIFASLKKDRPATCTGCIGKKANEPKDLPVLTPERLESLYRGCPSCDADVDDAPCTCPEPDEIRALVTMARGREKRADPRLLYSRIFAPGTGTTYIVPAKADPEIEGAVEDEDEIEHFLRMADLVVDREGRVLKNRWGCTTEQGEQVAFRKRAVSDIEALAALEHESWSGWTRWMLGKLREEIAAGAMGDEELDPERFDALACVQRWTRQMETPYVDLHEKEKESDREEVLKKLPTYQPQDDRAPFMHQSATVLREVLLALRAEAKECGLTNDDTAAMLEAACRAVFKLRPGGDA